jgi:hypothetical protein
MLFKFSGIYGISSVFARHGKMVTSDILPANGP